MQRELEGEETIDKGFKLSDRYKFDRKSEPAMKTRELEEIKEPQKDMFDVINEVEAEEDVDFDSDDSITKQYYQNMHQEVLMMGTDNMKKMKTDQELPDIFKDDWEFKDMLRIIDWNERRY
jgi:hypothetical protein